MIDLSSSLQSVRARIAEAERRFGRDRDSVMLLAVSKTRTPADILALAALGQRCFGENYLQEAMLKFEQLAGEGLEWHFIGKVQSNKTDAIARHCAWIHTLDREKLARRLNEQRPAELPPLNVCIQVNTSGESTKGGVTIAEIPALAEAIARYPRLRLRGLMTLPAPTTDFETQRFPFRQLAQALGALNRSGFQMDTLSMGTSDDFEAAIAEGATLVRVGSLVFGPRITRAAP